MDEGYRFHVQFHITNRCNLKCKHCYEGDKGAPVEWTYDDFVCAIDKLWDCFHKWNVKGDISLIGGEPTMHPDFYRMVEYLSSRGDVSTISILTNGTRIDDRFVEVMKANNCHVQVSIDGIDREHHDYIRGKGNYERTLNAARQLSNAGVSVSAHYVLSKSTVPLNRQLFDTLVSCGVTQVAFSRLVPFGNACKEDMLNCEELREAFDIIHMINQSEEYSDLSILTTRPLWCHYGYSGKCPAGMQTITILENGDIMPCRRLPIVIGNIKDDNFYRVWYTSPVLEGLRDRSKFSKCGSCEHLNDCGGARCIAYAVSGDYLGEDPQCWA